MLSFHIGLPFLNLSSSRQCSCTCTHRSTSWSLCCKINIGIQASACMQLGLSRQTSLGTPFGPRTTAKCAGRCATIWSFLTARSAVAPRRPSSSTMPSLKSTYSTCGGHQRYLTPGIDTGVPTIFSCEYLFVLLSIRGSPFLHCSTPTRRYPAPVMPQRPKSKRKARTADNYEPYAVLII